MKSVKFFSLFSLLLFTLSCNQGAELVLPENGSGISPILVRTPPDDTPLLNPAFSRGMGINNSGALVGSTRNEDGVVVAFKLTNHNLWLSDEVVAPNGLPEIRFSINDRGDVAAHKMVPGGIAPVVWKNGEAHDLPLLEGYQYGEVFDINASGQMAGEALNGNWLSPTAMRAVLYSADGEVEDLGTLGGAKAYAAGINDQGHVVGGAENALFQIRAYVYKDGVMEDIGTLGGTSANANSINNCGQIAGRSLLANGAIRGFLYSDGVMTDLGTLGGASSIAFDINDRGEVVGFSRVASGQAHAFLYKDGVMTDLGTLGGIDSRAISINNKGDIIGHYTLPDNTVHAFIYKDGEMIPL
jgi:probable HAF family extracellular repeat protein